MHTAVCPFKQLIYACFRLHHLDDELNHLIGKWQHLQDEFHDKVHDREAAQTKASNLKLRMAKGDREANFKLSVSLSLSLSFL